MPLRPTSQATETPGEPPSGRSLNDEGRCLPPKSSSAFTAAHGAISGCQVTDVRKLLNVKPYLGDNDNNWQNGLLLRADLHTLFDLLLIGINPAKNEPFTCIRRFVAPNTSSSTGSPCVLRGMA